MADVLSADDLSAYLSIDAAAPRPTLIRRLVNDLIAEHWANPEDPAPINVKLLALNVAARALAKVPGRGPVESVTRSFDDSTRTERYAVVADDGSTGEVFLTADELALLKGTATPRKVRSIKLAVPGFPTGSGYGF